MAEVNNWTWNEETELCVSRLFRKAPRIMQGSRTRAIRWLVNRAMSYLGADADLDAVAACIADHFHR